MQDIITHTYIHRDPANDAVATTHQGYDGVIAHLLIER
jgi:hypothetical protein